jgi:hypothetical protein
MDALTNIAETACEHCGTLFRPRPRGGSAQRFCTATCRYAFHAQQVPSVEKRGSSVDPSVDSNVSADFPSVQPACSTLETSTAAPEQPVEAKGREFDWNDDESIALREQRETAIY